MLCRPTASCFPIALRIASSTKAPSFLLRASASPGGRSRLPTWSAWKGGFIPPSYRGLPGADARPQVGNAVLRGMERAAGPVIARQLALPCLAGAEQVAFARLRRGGSFPVEMRGADCALLLERKRQPEPVAQRGVPRRMSDV